MSNRATVAIAGMVLSLTTAATAAAQSASADQDLRAEDAIRLASEHNPTLRAALLDREQAAAAVRAETGLYPLILQLDGGFTHSSNPYVDTGGDVSHRSSETTVLGAQLSKTLPIGTQTAVRVEGSHQLSTGASVPGETADRNSAYGLTARFSVTQPLIRGAGATVVEASLREALKSEALARHRARRITSELAAEILMTYWELWYTARAEEIETRARDLARAQLEEVETRVAEGDAAPVDALPFQTRLATLEESVVTAKASRDRLSVQLAGLIGFGSGRNHVTADTANVPATDGGAPETEEVIRVALANSPEVREQLATIALAEERAKTAGEQMRQRLDLMGWLEANTLGNGQVSPAFEQFGEGEAYSAYVGLVYELPLDDTRKDAQRASANQDVEIANQELLATRDSVRAEVLTVIEEISSARTRLELAAHTLGVAQQQAEAERKRYDLGAAIFVQVREAEEAVREADLRTTRAQVDLVLAELKLDHLTGRLLERYGDVLRAGTSKR